jgi:hypothetical protein
MASRSRRAGRRRLDLILVLQVYATASDLDG